MRYTLSCQCQFKNVLATDKIRIDDEQYMPVVVVIVEMPNYPK